MKTLGKVRWDRVILLTVGFILAICLMLQFFIAAAVDYSMKIYPPTAEELAEDPSLARYLK